MGENQLRLDDPRYVRITSRLRRRILRVTGDLPSRVVRLVRPEIEYTRETQPSTSQTHEELTYNPTGDTAEKAPEAPDEDDAVPESYWPNIQRHIESGEGPRPSVSCAICWRGLFHPNVTRAVASRHELEPLEVLDCGHVIGRKCWGDMVADAMVAKKTPICPFCRVAQWNWWWRYMVGTEDASEQSLEQQLAQTSLAGP